MSPIEGLLELFHLIAGEYGPAAAVVVLSRPWLGPRRRWEGGGSYQTLTVNWRCLKSGPTSGWPRAGRCCVCCLFNLAGEQEEVNYRARRRLGSIIIIGLDESAPIAKLVPTSQPTSSNLATLSANKPLGRAICACRLIRRPPNRDRWPSDICTRLAPLQLDRLCWHEN